MRHALPVAVCLAGSISLVVACTGGPGNLEQGGDNGDQYGGISGDTTGARVSEESNGGRGNSPGSSASSASSAGGPPPQPLRAESYDRKCEADADCGLVFIGDPCNPCVSCVNTAIARKDFSKYQSDLTAGAIACARSSSTSSGSACGPCNPPTATCVDKRCTP